jgi:hypothetical protein
MLQSTRDIFVSKQNITETVRAGSELKVLSKVFIALCTQCGCPRKASNKYLNLIVKGINCEGAGFLKVLAAQQVLGLRVVGNDMPKPRDYGLKVRKRTGFPILFAWFYSKLDVLSQAQPTKENAVLIQRILTVLSIGKMLTLGSKARINRERYLYAERVKRRLNFEKVQDYRNLYGSEIRAFLRYCRYKPRRTPTENGYVSLDPNCYSLKSLVKRVNRRYKFEIPEAVCIYLMHRSVMEMTKGLTPNASGLARRTVPDGKQTILVESGGKFRGITSYYSPLIHSTTMYASCRRALSGWAPDCSLDQSVGHERVRELTVQPSRLPVVSADASNFTDSLDLELVQVFTEQLGEDRFLEYLECLSVSTYSGIVSTPLPLMGLKGCFELGCLMLAFSCWRRAKRRSLRKRTDIYLKGAAHCCDDFACHGTLEAVAECYNFIGVSLNYKKTIVSHNTAVFCGKMYWNGLDVTPVRLNLTMLSKETSGYIVLPAIRNFLDACRPSWGRSVMRAVYPLIRRASIRCVGPYSVRFDLPTKVGGIPIPSDWSKGQTLEKVLEKRRNLRYALYNTPMEGYDRDRITSMIGYVRLGSPVKQPDGTILPSVTLPTEQRSGWRRRKLLVNELMTSGLLSASDVLMYYYS